MPTLIEKYKANFDNLFTLPAVETGGTLLSAVAGAAPWAVGIGALTFVLNTFENVMVARKEGRFPSVAVLRQIPEASVIAVSLAVGHPEVAVGVYLVEQLFQQTSRLRRIQRQKVL